MMRGLWTAANRAILINAGSLIATTAVSKAGNPRSPGVK